MSIEPGSSPYYTSTYTIRNTGTIFNLPACGYSLFSYDPDNKPAPYNRVWWKLTAIPHILGIFEFHDWLSARIRAVRIQIRRFTARVIFQPCWSANRWKSKT